MFWRHRPSTRWRARSMARPIVTSSTRMRIRGQRARHSAIRRDSSPTGRLNSFWPATTSGGWRWFVSRPSSLRAASATSSATRRSGSCFSGSGAPMPDSVACRGVCIIDRRTLFHRSASGGGRPQGSLRQDRLPGRGNRFRIRLPGRLGHSRPANGFDHHSEPQRGCSAHDVRRRSSERHQLFSRRHRHRRQRVFRP